MIKEILTHVWRAPILRSLADGPKRYAEVRANLVELKGSTPGDGYISTELRGLRHLGFVERSPIDNTRRYAWTLTEVGKVAVEVIDEFESPPAERPPARATKNLDPSSTAAHTELKSDDHSDRQSGLAMNELEARQNKIDTSVAHPARRYNYWLGGKDHFAADRASGDLIKAAHPTVVESALENRGFLRRSVEFLAGEAGVDMFLDIGTGLPTAGNTHEVAQNINPCCRVVYVDNDPMVMAHARALMTSTPQGRSFYLEKDLRNPDDILTHPEVAALLSSGRPVALMLIAVLHFIEDHTQARTIVHQLIDRLPSGSYVAASNFTLDYSTEAQIATYRSMISQGRADAYPRTRTEFEEFFTGLELVEPGIVSVSEWRSTVPTAKRITPREVAIYGAVGRKP